ncbi:MAG TPA: ABC transporter permease [Clostridiaceae bacterium]|nr:ABC transporter permease [Clostridiaceae bacterium]
MFRHLLKYSFKVYFYNKANIMWNFIFPFMFISVFFLALGNFKDPTAEFSKDPLKIAIIATDQQEAENLVEFLSHFGEEGVLEDTELQDTSSDDIFLKYQLTDTENADQLLTDQTVHAIVKADNPVEILAYNDLSKVKSSLLNQFLESYESVRKTTTAIGDRYADEKFSDLESFGISQLSEQDFNAIMEQAKMDIQAKHDQTIDIFAKESETTELTTSPLLIYFFAAIAYIAFFPTNAGVSTLEEVTANQSGVGLRNSVTPISKTKMFFAVFIPRWIIHCIFTLVIYLYVNLLGVNLGDNYIQIIVLLILGTTSAVLTGTAIGALFNFNTSLKVGISIAIPLVFGFASGMMYNGMPRVIAQYIPWFNKLNPIGIVSRGLYMLYSDPTFIRFNQQVIYLLGIIGITLILTIFGLRRNSYESI